VNPTLSGFKSDTNAFIRYDEDELSDFQRNIVEHNTQSASHDMLSYDMARCDEIVR
jgi:hypothetical protein